jgi:bacitracin transport system permease protein
MFRLIRVELKKLTSSRMLWLIVVGGVIPAIIAALMLMNHENIGWKSYLNVSMDVFNSQSLLTFACFTSFIWAREYEENTMEITLCYPYPKYYLLMSKLVVLLLIIICTTILWVLGSGISGALFLGQALEKNIVFQLLKVLGPIVLMQFMLLTITFYVTILTKQILSGVAMGVMCVALCTIFQTSSFIQYIPFCIPLVISHNLFGFHNIILYSYSTSWYILIASFVISLFLCIFTLKKKWEFR